MRKLNRLTPGPNGLSNYNYNTQQWKDGIPNKACKKEIWQHLQIMQSGFCAYCESKAVIGDGHIEHFFHKGRKPDGSTPFKHLTFDWENLFGSCGFRGGDSCGHYKDREGPLGPGSYDSNHIIKPDLEDPKEFFVFLDTGVIEPKPGLSDHDLRRASETLRVLNLALHNGARRRQIDIFKAELLELAKISETLDEPAIQQEIDNIKANVKLHNFQTAVLQSLFS